MLYNEFRRNRPDNAVVVHLDGSFYDVFGEDVSLAKKIIPAIQISAFTWNDVETPVFQRTIFSLSSDVADLSAAGYQVYTCRTSAGICHYELFQEDEPVAKSDKRPVPPPGYTSVSTKGNLLQLCPVCKQREGRWWGPDKSATGKNVIFQDAQAQAMFEKVAEDRDDWNWMSSLLYQIGFEPKHIWRLMRTAPVWQDSHYFVEGNSLVSHWSRYAVGGCDCGTEFWHDWGQPNNYYVKFPAAIKRKTAKTKAVPDAVNNGQLSLF